MGYHLTCLFILKLTFAWNCSNLSNHFEVFKKSVDNKETKEVTYFRYYYRPVLCFFLISDLHVLSRCFNIIGNGPWHKRRIHSFFYNLLRSQRNKHLREEITHYTPPSALKSCFICFLNIFPYFFFFSVSIYLFNYILPISHHRQLKNDFSEDFHTLSLWP